MGCLNPPKNESGQENEDNSNNNTNKLSKLKWNWFYVVLSSSLLSIGSSSPLGTLHQFLTNPNTQTIDKAHSNNLFEPGLGVNEGTYAWAVSADSVGGFLGGLSGGVLASIIPYWHGFLIALLFDVIGFLIYSIAQYGWMVILAKLFIGTYSGLQRSLVYAYIAISYQSYVEIKQHAGEKVNLTKYCRVKDVVFSLYTISVSAGYFIGAGFSAVLALFMDIDHYRAVGWFNFALGVLTILLQFLTFHGESNWKGTYREKLASHWKSGLKCMNSTNLSTLLILGFLLLCTGVIKSRTAVYELLLNPILSDTFGFSAQATAYYFLIILVVPVFGGLLLFVLQWSKISNLFISILGIIASIIGLAIMSDWQAITRDPCLNYSLYHNPELVTNMSIGSSSFSPPPTCWNKTQLREHGDIVYDVTNAMVIDGHLVFYYYPLMNNDVMVNCRVHVSTSTCYICKNSSDLTSHVELHFKNTQGEICYNPSFTKFNNQATSSLKFSVICGKSDSTCLSLCLHVHQDSHDTAAIQGTAETEGDTRQLFHHAYTKSLLLLQEFLYDSARNTCESETTARCHWIPHSLVTHKTCRDCQPICRGLSHTMTFIQFVAGSIWFMLTYPVAEVALPVVISDSTQNDYQGILMGLTVATTEMFQSVTPLWSTFNTVMKTYELAERRTFLPMMILIATFLPFLLGLMLLYRKLLKLRESRLNAMPDEGREIYELVNQTD